jgi:hypothetical protein
MQLALFAAIHTGVIHNYYPKSFIASYISHSANGRIKRNANGVHRHGYGYGFPFYRYWAQNNWSIITHDKVPLKGHPVTGPIYGIFDSLRGKGVKVSFPCYLDWYMISFTSFVTEHYHQHMIFSTSLDI